MSDKECPVCGSEFCSYFRREEGHEDDLSWLMHRIMEPCRFSSHCFPDEAEEKVRAILEAERDTLQARVAELEATPHGKLYREARDKLTMASAANCDLNARVAELEKNQRPEWIRKCASCGWEQIKVGDDWKCGVCERNARIFGLQTEFGKQMADMRNRLVHDSRERIDREFNAGVEVVAKIADGCDDAHWYTVATHHIPCSKGSMIAKRARALKRPVAE